MDFLKRLFGGGGKQGVPGDKDGMYFYIRSDRSGEVIRVRLHRFNDLSLMDDNKSYLSRKVIVGTQSFDRIEAEFVFNNSRSLMSCELTGGELVEAGDYEAYLAKKSAESTNADA